MAETVYNQKYIIAGLKTQIEHGSETLKKQGLQYESDFAGAPDISVARNEQLINTALRLWYKETDMAEYMISAHDFYLRLLDFNGLMIHSSAVVADGECILFSASSGVGKSTHAGMWLQMLGNRAFILNDDKPAVRLIDDKFYAYGTPWSGKTDCSKNEKAPVKALVFLERSHRNYIERINPQQAFRYFYPQTIRVAGPAEMDKQLALVNRFMKDIPMFLLHCRPDIEAAETAYSELKKI